MLPESLFFNKIGFITDSKYILDLRWSSVSYSKNVFRLNNAMFTGPAIKIIDQITSYDQIVMDLYKQYYMYASDVYMATLSWGPINIDIINNTIYLKNAKISYGITLKKSIFLKDDDYIRIDTSDHEQETHINFPLYKATVINNTGTPYNFWKTDGMFRKVIHGKI